MGVATLNVWVRDRNFPCRPSMRVWSVDVFVCNGEPLHWCGTTFYGAHRTECGHVRIEVPPGCYIVRARTGSSGHHNLFTHVTMVVVSCGDTACVNLVPPGAWTCGQQFNMALRFHERAGNLPKDLVRQAIEANKAVIEHLPRDRVVYDEGRALEDVLKGTEEEEAEREKDDC